MRKTEIAFTDVALRLREDVNIALVVFMFVLCFLLARFVIKEIYARRDYRGLPWEVKFAIGLFVLFVGEMLRAGTVWEIIHYQGTRGTYATDVLPLIGSLLLVAIGGLCAIRVMTPQKWGNTVWVGSLIVACLLLLISRAV